MTVCPKCGQEPGSRWFCRHCGAALSNGPSGELAVRRHGRVRRWFAWAGAIVVTLLLALVIAASLDFNPAALGLSVIAALAPAMVYCWLVLRLDRYEAEPLRAILGAFAWGAIGAATLALILEIITGGALIFVIGDNAASVVSSVLAAPIIEETTKGIALLVLLRWRRDEFDDLLDGLIYGAVIGLGFAMTENVLYFGAEYLKHGAGGLGRLFVARVVLFGFGHAVYTATTGAAVGWAREHPERRGAWRLIPVAGWALAVLQHVLWNGSLVVIDGMLGRNVSLLKVVLIQAPLFVIPPLIVLFMIAKFAGRREMQVLADELRGEVDAGVLTRDEYAILISDALRKRQTAWSRAHGGAAQVRRQRRFFQTAAELAFLKRRLARAGDSPELVTPDAYRAELAALRMALIANHAAYFSP